MATSSVPAKKKKTAATSAQRALSSSFHAELEERLVRYARIDTQSDEASPTSPSTSKQFDLLRLLADELREIGAQDVTLTDYGAVLATIPATVTTQAPTIAFLAHVDTAPAFNATGVKPIVHRKYAGGDIVLPDDPHAVLSPAHFPYLAQKIGDDIITASGTTLLGADDKAGVAIVMTLAHYLLRNPDLAHGPIRIAFTPDEEIGRGVHPNLPRDLKVEAAYTLDGAEQGEVVFETFSADKATVTIQGVSTHPGDAKDELVNALHLAAKIVMTLPHVTLTPETTDGRQGFIHLYQMSGTAAEAELHFIVRDFERDGLRAHGELIQQVCATVQATEPRARITCDDHSAVSQHARLARKGHAPGRIGARGLPPARHRADLHADSRRHRRLAADGAGRPDTQPLHRHAEHPRAAGMGQRAGYGRRDHDVRQPRAVVGRRAPWHAEAGKDHGEFRKLSQAIASHATEGACRLQSSAGQ